MVMSDAIWPLQGFIELSVHRSMLQVLSPLLWVFDLSINLFIFALGQCYIKFSINQFIDFSDKWRKWNVWNAGEQFLEFLKCSWICEWSWRSSPRASSARRWMSGRCPCETFLACNRKREITEITEITALLLSFCSYFVISSNCSVFLCPLLKSLFRASIGFQASPRQPAQDPAVSPPDFGQIALHVRH